MKCNVYNKMYNVQIIPTHNKQIFYQPQFPKNNMDNKKIINKQRLKKIINLPSLA